GVEGGDGVAPEGRAHQRDHRIQDDGGDEREAGAEPQERLPPASTGKRRQRLAATAPACRRSSTCFGLPPGCTARPMLCWTSSLTPSQAGSVVGTSFALGSASR